MKNLLVILLLVLNISIVPCAAMFTRPFEESTPSDTLYSRDGEAGGDVWHDGVFQGVWGAQRNSTLGTMQGTLRFRRTNTMGVVNGVYTHSDDNTTGFFNGYFWHSCIIGYLGDPDASNKEFCIGRLVYDDRYFSGTLFNLNHGRIWFSGGCTASFLPPLTGQYSVGVKPMHLIDNNRSEGFTDDPDDVRELMVQVWYPSISTSTGEQSEYMDAVTFAWLKRRSPIPLITIPNDAYLFVQPHAQTQVDIAPGCFPIVLFSPGYTGVDTLYTSFIEDLVSHGFIVCSMNHPYTSGITVFPDGRIVETAPVPSDPSEVDAYFHLGMQQVKDDAQFTLDILTGLNRSDPFWQGHLNSGRVGMYGHSFGGGSTAVCCYEDDRFTAGFTLDGYFRDEFITGSINDPFALMVVQRRFTGDPSVEHMWETIQAHTYKLGVAGATHQAFTDLGVLLTHFTPFIPIQLLGFGTIDAKNMVNLTRVCIITFFQVYLKEYPRQLLDELPDLFPELNYSYKKQ